MERKLTPRDVAVCSLLLLAKVASTRQAFLVPAERLLEGNDSNISQTVLEKLTAKVVSFCLRHQQPYFCFFHVSAQIFLTT